MNGKHRADRDPAEERPAVDYSADYTAEPEAAGPNAAQPDAADPEAAGPDAAGETLDQPVLDGAEDHSETDIDPRKGMSDPALIRDIEHGKRTINPYG